MSIETMKMALATLEDIFGKNKVDVEVINALRQVIKQAEKPCKTGSQCIGGKCSECEQVKKQGVITYRTGYESGYMDASVAIKREWVGLTDDEVESWRGSYDFFDSSLVRKVEAKLKEKNT
jgi:hypothetical protein